MSTNQSVADYATSLGQFLGLKVNVTNPDAFDMTDTNEVALLDRMLADVANLGFVNEVNFVVGEPSL